MTSTNKLLVGIIGVLLLLGVTPEWGDFAGYHNSGSTAINIHRASDEQCIRLDRIAFQLSRIADAAEYHENVSLSENFKLHPTNRQLKK